MHTINTFYTRIYARNIFIPDLIPEIRFIQEIALNISTRDIFSFISGLKHVFRDSLDSTL